MTFGLVVTSFLIFMMLKNISESPKIFSNFSNFKLLNYFLTTSEFYFPHSRYRNDKQIFF